MDRGKTGDDRHDDSSGRADGEEIRLVVVEVRRILRARNEFQTRGEETGGNSHMRTRM